MMTAVFLLTLILFAPSPAEITVVQFPSKGKANISLGGKNKADVERGGTVTRVAVQMEGLQPPSSSRPGMNSYVVWTISPEGIFENLGELELSGTKGSLEASTRFDRFGILITAEPHYMVDKPGSRIVYKNEPSRDHTNVPLTIEVGAYDYVNLPSNDVGVPVLVMQARAAISIATAGLAAQRAESEYRQARVAMDTMEELLRRASPPDVVSSAAHVAIRRAHIATTVARQSVR